MQRAESLQHFQRNCTASYKSKSHYLYWCAQRIFDPVGPNQTVFLKKICHAMKAPTLVTILYKEQSYQEDVW